MARPALGGTTLARRIDTAFEDRGDLADHDVELWFRCYRRLPEYDDLAALERLSVIAGSRTSPVCSYYLYVVHFLRRLDQEEYSQDEALRRCDETAHLNHGRSRRWNYDRIPGAPVGRGGRSV